MDEQERRIEERAACDIAAKIKLSDRLAIAVTVKDLSATGVQMLVPESVHLPDEFDLLIPVLEGIDQRYRVKTVWRSKDSLGGEFVSRTHIQ